MMLSKAHRVNHCRNLKPYSFNLISQHLKSINYDRWASLHWKKQLETLSAAQEKELDALEKENMRTVEEVYGALSSDKEIKEQIEKIKSHPRVKVLEGDGK